MNQSALRILTFTTLFPNQEQQGHGLFVRERVRALSEIADLRVTAPVPWFPAVRSFFGDRYYRYSLVPRAERQFGMLVDHPRYLVIPKLFKATDPLLLAMGSVKSLSRLRTEFPFNVIDAHWAYPDGVAAAILAHRFRVPFSITVRGDDLNVFLDSSSRRRWIRWALRKANLVIALSRALGDIAVSNGTPPSRLAVIPNGINAQEFFPVDPGAARAHLGLPNGQRIVLSVGRLHVSKGFPTIVAAVGRLAHSFPDVHVYIVGAADHEADARPAILATAKRLHLEDRLHLVGPQDPALLKYWYAAADVFCLPTAREGSANVLIEAIACGLPCVTTPVGGNRDVITSPELGYLVEADASATAAAIAAALSRTWDRRHIAQLGHRRTWQTVAGECRDHLSETLSECTPRRHGYSPNV